MGSTYHLGITDYVVIAASLLVSALIGIVFRFTGGRQKTINEYLLAGKNSCMLPVIMSATVTMISGITLMGTPAEVYKFGSQYAIYGVSTILGMFCASRVFVPVYFRCGVSSIYEYLEMRYGKYTRYTISAIFVVQMIFYMSVVLYAPVLALSAVTEFSIEMAIIVCGSVCTFYCFLGGLKAVLWADVFQGILMYLCVFIIYIMGIYEVGGIGEIYRRSKYGDRLQLFDMSLDFSKRYTFWNVLFRGLSFGFGFYGCNQVEVQRLLSMSGTKRAQSALQWSTIPLGVLHVFAALIGLVMYSVFYKCDPVLMQLETGITKYDQLVPYFIITRLKSYPGLTGLCIAGIFSGSLSTISSAVNSLSTVTVVDFIQPTFANRLTERKMVFIAKGLSLLFGVICILFTFALSGAGSILQAATVFASAGEGTVLAIFLIGALTRKVSDKCAMSGILVGIVIISWIGLGSMYGGFHSPARPLETTLCSVNTTENDFKSSIDSSFGEKADEERYIFPLYKIAFCWIGAVGCLLTLCVTFIISLFIDRNKDMISPDSKCLSPIVEYWKKTEASSKSYSSTENEVHVKETVFSG